MVTGTALVCLLAGSACCFVAVFLVENSSSSHGAAATLPLVLAVVGSLGITGGTWWVETSGVALPNHLEEPEQKSVRQGSPHGRRHIGRGLHYGK